MGLKKKDFIEIEFTGKIKNGEIFDSNIKEDIEKVKLNTTPKPLVFCLGEGMFLKGVDDFLIGKEIGKYTIELSPEKAFGNRESRLVQMIPMKVFQQHKINPVPGVMFNFDNRMAKILTVSGGRVMVDFNNPLAGKDIVYEIKVLRKVEDTNEKIKAFNEFLFRKDFKFKIENKKLILEVEKPMLKFVEMFKEKFKEIFNLELEVKEVEEKVKKEEIKEKNDKK
ncbi:peptidylprolyl isomerase [Candidatus Pacearchaeota archaeon]|nr:peptidylprolyl isomerase [Candidatus Pacearchaeota archaeon]